MTDLWPDIKDVPKRKTPNIILEEQASLLKEKTKDIVQAEIKRTSPGTNIFRGEIVIFPFMYVFFIKAPVLRYKYKLFSIAYDIFMYPTYFDIDIEITREILGGKQGEINANNEEEYLGILRKIFNSEKTISIIQSIISQVT
jgi:hypothetical protein